MNNLTTIAALPRMGAGCAAAMKAEPTFTPFSTITAIGSEAPAVPLREWRPEGAKGAVIPEDARLSVQNDAGEWVELPRSAPEHSQKGSQ